MKPTSEQINHAIKQLSSAGYVVKLIHRDRIRNQASDRDFDLSEEEVDEVVRSLEDMDVDWDLVDFVVQELVDARKS